MGELVAEGLVIRAGDRVLVDGVSLRLGTGEVLALVGSSGAGKSITTRALIGRVPCTPGLVAGQVRINEATPRTEADWARLRGHEVALLLQDARGSLDPLRTVGRIVATAGDGRDPRVALGAAGLGPEVLGLYPHELSGGMAQRAALAAVIARGARFVIADEPTTGLDAQVQRGVAATLASLADAGVGVLIVTHDLRLVAGLAHRVLVMEGGRIVDEAASPALLAGPGRALVDATRRIAGGALG